MPATNVTCQGCKQTGFHFETYKTVDGISKMRLVDAFGTVHNCKEYRDLKAAEAGKVPSAGIAMPATAGVAVTSNTVSDMIQRLNTVEKSNNDAVSLAGETMVNVLELRKEFQALQQSYNSLLKDYMSLDSKWEAKLSAGQEIVIKNADTGVVVNVGRQHKLFPTLVRMVRASKGGKIVTLVGDSGSGKTFVVEPLAKALVVENFYVIGMNNQISVSQLQGFMSGHGEYVDSPIYKVVKYGGVLLFDEFSAGNPNSLMALQMAATNRFVGFPNGETVFKHPECYIIAADNVNGAGGNDRYGARNKLDEATRRRLAILRWDTDWDLMEYIVSERGQDVTWVKKSRAISRILERQKIQYGFGGRDALTGAEWLAEGFTEAEVLQAFLWEHISEAERAQVESQMGVMS